MHTVQLLGVEQDEKQAETKHSNDVRCQRQQEQEEVTVISPADAVIHPWTVMVKILYTVVTDGAVRAAGGSVEAASGAPLHPHLDATDLHSLIEWGAEIILLILIFLRSGEDAGVHECGHAKVGEDKKEDDSIVDGNGNREPVGQPGAPGGGGVGLKVKTLFHCRRRLTLKLVQLHTYYMILIPL